MKYTQRQKEIILFLENLVWKRFTEQELNEELSNNFYEDIKVVNVSANREAQGDSDGLADFNLMFASEKESTYGDFDIYVLPTREIDEQGNVKLFITEVGYEFSFGESEKTKLYYTTTLETYSDGTFNGLRDIDVYVINDNVPEKYGTISAETDQDGNNLNTDAEEIAMWLEEIGQDPDDYEPIRL